MCCPTCCYPTCTCNCSRPPSTPTSSHRGRSSSLLTPQLTPQPSPTSTHKSSPPLTRPPWIHPGKVRDHPHVMYRRSSSTRSSSLSRRRNSSASDDGGVELHGSTDDGAVFTDLAVEPTQSGVRSRRPSVSAADIPVVLPHTATVGLTAPRRRLPASHGRSMSSPVPGVDAASSSGRTDGKTATVPRSRRGSSSQDRPVVQMAVGREDETESRLFMATTSASKNSATVRVSPTKAVPMARRASSSQGRPVSQAAVEREDETALRSYTSTGIASKNTTTVRVSAMTKAPPVMRIRSSSQDRSAVQLAVGRADETAPRSYTSTGIASKNTATVRVSPTKAVPMARRASSSQGRPVLQAAAEIAVETTPRSYTSTAIVSKNTATLRVSPMTKTPQIPSVASSSEDRPSSQPAVCIVGETASRSYTSTAAGSKNSATVRASLMTEVLSISWGASGSQDRPAVQVAVSMADEAAPSSRPRNMAVSGKPATVRVSPMTEAPSILQVAPSSQDRPVLQPAVDIVVSTPVAAAPVAERVNYYIQSQPVKIMASTGSAIGFRHSTTAGSPQIHMRVEEPPHVSEELQPLPAAPYQQQSSVEAPKQYVSKKEIVRTTDTFCEKLTDFIDEMDLGSFYPPGDPYLAELSTKAAALRLDKNKSLTLNREEDVVDLAKLALYDTVIYCDDSISMNSGTRISALKNLVRRVSKITTMLDATGIKVRFINYRGDTHYNDIRTTEEAERIMHSIDFQGPATQLGTSMKSKILEPLLYNKIRKGGLKKPLLVVVVTDGEPTGESPGHFRNVIADCETFLKRNNYNSNTAVFQVNQVGNDTNAENFISTLHNDSRVGHLVHCTSEQMDKRIAELHGNKQNLERWLLDLLMLGLRPVAPARPSVGRYYASSVASAPTPEIFSYGQ